MLTEVIRSSPKLLVGRFPRAPLLRPQTFKLCHLWSLSIEEKPTFRSDIFFLSAPTMMALKGKSLLWPVVAFMISSSALYASFSGVSFYAFATFPPDRKRVQLAGYEHWGLVFLLCLILWLALCGWLIARIWRVYSARRM